jgi:hypothetical protein
MNKGIRFAVAGLVLAAQWAWAQPQGGHTFEAGSNVAAIVRVPKPWYAPRALVAGKMRDAMPQYQAVPGLAHKAFTLAQADGRYGGIYLWKDLNDARGYFAPAWFERVQQERGVPGEVRFFEVPLMVDNQPPGTAADAHSSGVATLVTIAMPAGVTKARVLQGFQAALPEYKAVSGLLRKYFILTGDGRFGGIYLWKDQDSAERWFNTAWKERVRKTYGTDANIEWYDTPILLPSTLASNLIPAQP